MDEEDPGRRRKKRRKSSRNEDGSRKRRKDKDSGDGAPLARWDGAHAAADVDDLDDDDLALMEENTGMRLGANRGDVRVLHSRERELTSWTGPEAEATATTRVSFRRVR